MQRRRGCGRAASMAVFAAAAFAAVVLGPEARADGASDARVCEAAIRSGDHRAAVTFCTIALNGSSLDREARATLLAARGRAQLSLGERDAAIEDFSAALALTPGKIEVVRLRGFALLARVQRPASETVAAIRDWSRVLSVHPDDRNALLFRGVLHLERGSEAAATADFTTALELDPGFANALYQRAEAHRRVGARDAALEDYERAFELGGRVYVRAAQMRLRACGRDPGPIDGAYGPGTKRALVAMIDAPESCR